MDKDYSLEITKDYLKQKSENRFTGFDFLRAIFSVVVVALHSNIFNLLSGKTQWSFVSNILTMNVGYVAVPVFIQISLFLFFINSKKFGSHYFTQKRFPKLISLYLFWMISKTLFDALFGNIEAIKLGLSSFDRFILFIVSGGHTIFYFFPCLLFLTAIAQSFNYLMDHVKKTSAKKLSYYLLFLSSVLVFSFPIIDLLNRRESFSQIINYFNFLPYIFIAAIVALEFGEGKLENLSTSLKLKMLSLSILAVLFMIIEWKIFENFPDRSRLFPHYARLSLTFVSWLLLYLALLFTQRVPTIIRLISQYSLGIYGFHIFFTDHTSFLDSLSQIIPGLGAVIKFLVALTCSIALTFVFKQIKVLRNFV
ncbi:MAG: acyltransferase [Acaryochloridaceae cyanobacterium SU_2_1]|nr:acyltransferase [Acaryochloridaceae cyanobacterium SU_2_1]